MDRKEVMRRVRLCALALVACAIGTGRIVVAGGGDDCFSAPATIVPVGAPGSPITTTVTGDNTFATCDTGNCPAGTDLGWYEAFEIDTCAKVTFDFCGQDPVTRPAFIAIWHSCPFTDAIVADSFSRATPCTDFNIWFQFNEVPPGRYWYQIITIPGDERC